MQALIMNDKLVQSAAQLRRYFDPLAMLRTPHAFAQTAYWTVRPLSDRDRCASFLFIFTLLRMDEQLPSLDLSRCPLPENHTFDLTAFSQLPENIAKQIDPANALCDAYQAQCEALLHEKKDIGLWCLYDGLNDLMTDAAELVLRAPLDQNEKTDAFFLLVSGCCIAHCEALPRISPDALAAAFRRLPPTPREEEAAFTPLPDAQLLSLPQREAPYLLPTVQNLPQGASLRPLCVVSAPHARGSGQFETVLHFTETLAGPPLSTQALPLHARAWLTAVWENDAPVAVVPALRVTPGCAFVDELTHPVHGTLRLLSDGTADISQYTNAAHRLFLQEIRDEKLVEMTLNGGELLVLTDRGLPLSSTGRDFDALRVTSLTQLIAAKEADHART